MRLAGPALVLVAALLAGPGGALAETLAIPSLTLDDGAFLRGDAVAGVPVEVSGDLLGVASGERRPAVILIHGSDGPRSGAVLGWAQFLVPRGVAVLRLDSYTARGLGDASAAQDDAAQFWPIVDAYRAVEVLAARPDIDPDRILLMGFSRGGVAALYAAMDRFHETFGPRRGRIAAYLPFYPACNFTFERQLEVADAPIRVFHGTIDDWTPIGPCRDHVAALAAAGADAEITAFEGAHHAFDNVKGPALVSDPAWQTSRNCWREERDGVLVNRDTGRPFGYGDACVERGPHSRYDGAATEAAQAAVMALIEALGTE